MYIHSLTGLITILLMVNQSAAAEAAVDKLDDLLSGITTLSADVLQLIVESDGGVLEESDISMQLKKPDGFYWETVAPFPELIVTNGVKLWNYQPDLEQVVVEDWQTDQSELAAQLLSGRTDNLQKEYEIQLENSSGESRSHFALTPYAVDSIYSSISIQFVQSSLDSIVMDSKNGERTVWRFSNVVRNQPIEDSVFSFVPPAGIEVIENSYAQ